MIPVLLLDHVPPDVASPRVVVAAGQTTEVPVMAAGFAFTDIGVVTKHPDGIE